ncbi:unnamed protein product [Rotaria sp. Silwood1]|nr:unnamed protein product [Rotaria sp. Silwood1]CAF1221942.1 unnamed protein product [Rotaria sp. Silwood1]
MAEQIYLTDPETGERFRLGGCLTNGKPLNIPKYGATRCISNMELPPSVDLRQFMSPVEHQGNINSCGLFIYYNARIIDKLQENQMVDRGTYIISAIQGLKKFGCCKVETYPFDPANVNLKPPPECYTEAEKRRIDEAMMIRAELNEMKGCLAEANPFAFGLRLFPSFAQAGSNGGRVKMPNIHSESQSVEQGCHAMLAVGYSDESGCFIVRNTWGEKWGDKGYCYIPYHYMCNPQLCCDLYAIKMVYDEFVHEKDTSILNRYDWNVDKDKRYYIPPNYPYQCFDYKFFWNLNDTFNYFTQISQNGQIVPFIWRSIKTVDNNIENHKAGSSKTERPTSFILWIDKKNHENAHIEKRLRSEKNVKIDFYEALSRAEAHMLKYKHKIKLSSTFQIICHGYYKEENKNPLNILSFLNDNSLSHVPVLVFTNDKVDLQTRLQSQAPSMGINDWKQRLFITGNHEELIKKIKETIADKSSDNKS